MKTIKTVLKPTITIKGCTDKTCGDCTYYDHYKGANEMGCSLFRKQLKECQDEKYKIEYEYKGDRGWYYDMAKCKECLDAQR